MTIRGIITGEGEITEGLHGIYFTPNGQGRHPLSDGPKSSVSNTVEPRLLFEILLLLSRTIPGESNL